MKRRMAALVVATAVGMAPAGALAFSLPAREARGLLPQVDVSVANNKLKIAATATSDGPMDTKVDYSLGSDVWSVDGIGLVAGAGCSGTSNTVTCPENGENVAVDFKEAGGSITLEPADDELDFNSTIKLGAGGEQVVAADGVDAVTSSEHTAIGGDEVDTRGGDDEITTANGTDQLIGGLGDDVLKSGQADDLLEGGPGGPIGPDGADTLNGGADNDTLSYENRESGVDATIGGTGGETGEGDTINANVENLIGTQDRDTLTGDADANVLEADDGNDVLAGGAGSGPDGADTLDGGDHYLFGGGDTVTYRTRTDDIVAQDGQPSGAGGCPGGAGCEDDQITGVEHLSGGRGNDTLTGTPLKNELTGGAGTGDDTLSGGEGDDRFVGGTGQNSGPDGADTFIAGGQGSEGDTVSYEGRADELTVDIGGAPDPDGDDVQSQIDNLRGGEADDVLTGDADDNDFIGGGGADTMFGGTGTGPDGADRFSGGVNEASRDTVSYANRTDPLSVTIGVPTAEGDLLASTAENIIGGSDDDQLTGGFFPNVLDGGPGNDILVGEDSGDDGDDTYIGGPGEADLADFSGRTSPIVADIGGGLETDGNDVRGDIENVTGGLGDDVLTGDGDANTLRGGSDGDDTLLGGASPGPDGPDVFLVGGGVGSNIDTVSYANRDDEVTADIGGGADDVDGDDISSDADNLVGGSGADVLTGDGDPNTLVGGAGQDSLIALAGADTVDLRDDGPDSADCGTEADTALIDSATLDTPLVGCETTDNVPQTEITKKPARKITKRTAKFEFESPTPGVVGFECRLDDAAFASCESPHRLTGLSLGKHKFQVRAIDGDGDPDISPAKAGFKVVKE